MGVFYNAPQPLNIQAMYPTPQVGGAPGIGRSGSKGPSETERIAREKWEQEKRDRIASEQSMEEAFDPNTGEFDPDQHVINLRMVGLTKEAQIAEAAHDAHKKAQMEIDEAKEKQNLNEQRTALAGLRSGIPYLQEKALTIAQKFDPTIRSITDVGNDNFVFKFEDGRESLISGDELDKSIITAHERLKLKQDDAHFKLKLKEELANDPKKVAYAKLLRLQYMQDQKIAYNPDDPMNRLLPAERQAAEAYIGGDTYIKVAATTYMQNPRLLAEVMRNPDKVMETISVMAQIMRKAAEKQKGPPELKRPSNEEPAVAPAPKMDPETRRKTLELYWKANRDQYKSIDDLDKDLVRKNLLPSK